MNINALFYADDGIILTDNKKEAENNISTIKRISLKYGLEINTNKSKIIVYNKKESFGTIGGIEETDEIKYLGIKITNKRNMFKEHLQNQYKKAKKFENMTFSMIESSCDRMTVGKAYWKNVCMPSIIYGFNIIKINNAQINKLQIIENNVYRKILKAPIYTPVETLRGEIGSSQMKTRIIKGKILYWKSIVERNNGILNELLITRRSILNDDVTKYLELTGISKREVISNNAETIGELMRQWDEDNWIREINKKKSIEIYCRFKNKIQEVTYYNENKSLFMFRLRTNTVNLNDRKRHSNEDTKCNLCGHSMEDLIHFLLHCPKLEEERKKITYWQRPRIENESTLIGQLLFNEENIEEKILFSMWLKRKTLSEASIPT